MTRQIVRTAALGTAVLLAGAASVAFGAEPFPNPSMIHRYVGSDTNETWQGVVNNGVVWKRGGGTVTMPAPALNGGGRLNVTAGDVVLDLDAAPTVPTLPDYIVNKIKFWLDPNTNIVLEGDLVTKWFDRRETNITDAVASYVYPYASSEFHWVRPVPTDDRRPKIITGSQFVTGNFIDFGAYGTNSCRWLCITNSGVAGGLIRPRELFVVCAGKGMAGFTMFSTCRGDAGSNRPRPCWTGGPNNGGGSRLWGSTDNTRADKGSTRLDRNPVWGGYLPILDAAWHLVSTRLPNINDECHLNQIGLDRDLMQYSGGFVLAEVIMFEQRLSEFDRMRVEDYLWKKWMKNARQTSVGTLAIATNACVSVATSSDVSGALAGGGVLVKSGTGTTTLVDDGFTGSVELQSGRIRSEGLPLAVKATGQRLAVGAQGLLNRYDDAAAGTVEKTGGGDLSVASLPADAKVRVTAGTMRLVPPEPKDDFLSPAVFSNATFEAFTGSAANNVGGGAGTTVAQTNMNWVFDRSMYASGGNLVVILSKSLYHDTGSHWNLQPEDSLGLGYEGNRFLYICHGRATGSFSLPAAGMYRLVFSLGARDSGCLKPMKMLIDGVELCDYTSFNWLSFMRFEVALPWLSAGEHTLTFTDTDTDTKTVMMDDIKIVPVRAAAEAPVKVEIANPGFEESISNYANTGYAFKPRAADCTGWTKEEVSNGFGGGIIVRRWFDGVTDVDAGLWAWPDEMAGGFLCAQIYGSIRPLSQTVTLPSAGRYRLTFHLAKRCGLSPQHVNVKLDDRIIKQAWVRHDDWKEYEAVFDVEEGGEKLLTFVGTVDAKIIDGVGLVYTGGSAWLDDIALERVSETVPENLVANGGFESVDDSWTYHAGCMTRLEAGKNVSLWFGQVKEQAPQGTNCVFMYNADGALRQQVAFPAAGRYELSFRVKRFRANMNLNSDSQRCEFYVLVGTNYIWRSNVLQHEAERVIRQPFTVPAAGTYQLEFHTAFGANNYAYLLLDDVAIVAAPAADRTDLSDYIPENIELDVADGARLTLDFDGVAKVKGIRYNGQRLVGEISHATCPSWVMGRGVLSASPRGTVIMFR